MRYLLFSYEDYQASGGAYNFNSSGDDLTEIVNIGQSLKCDAEPVHNWHIFDTETEKVVAGGRND